MADFPENMATLCAVERLFVEKEKRVKTRYIALDHYKPGVVVIDVGVIACRQLRGSPIEFEPRKVKVGDRLRWSIDSRDTATYVLRALGLPNVLNFEGALDIPMQRTFVVVQPKWFYNDQIADVPQNILASRVTTHTFQRVIPSTHYWLRAMHNKLFYKYSDHWIHVGHMTDLLRMTTKADPFGYPGAPEAHEIPIYEEYLTWLDRRIDQGAT